ncbi:MAG: NAD-dependent epimerase [Chloroflexota bacterium]|nr:MAG: NAD-dependent epimerase [Chloroflexota bacterium]
MMIMPEQQPAITVQPRILITGGSGRIGTLISANLRTRYSLILLDRRPPADPTLPFVHADISNADALAPHVQGIDTVLHLAAELRPTAPWTSIFPNNVVGTYNVMQAACAAGCRRVVFASSAYAVLGYPPHILIESHMPPRPPNLYGASKAWGEALAREYAAASNTSILCVRIGYLVEPDAAVITPKHPALDLALTPRDLISVLTACIEAPDQLRFGIYHAVSHPHSRRFDMRPTAVELGFIPADDARRLAWRNLRGMLRRVSIRLRRCRKHSNRFKSLLNKHEWT